MRKLFMILVAVLLTASAFAQAPEKISYQAVVRDGSNNLVSSTAVGMQFSILQGSASGTVVYVETHTPNTNSNGLLSLEIGTGTVISGNFTTIDWANGSYFIKTETDPSGGTNYTITGTIQLLSVPYALYAKTSGSSTPGPSGVTGAAGIQGPIGPTGLQGATGLSGAQGLIGITGPIGTTGIQGPIGSTGLQGATGPSGAQGLIGVTGPAGTSGVQGSIGSTGLQGATGSSGAQGQIGMTGPTGVQGQNGIGTVQAGTNINITGTGTTLSPYLIEAVVNETDSIFVASVAHGISAIDTANWNNILDTIIDNDTTNEIQNLKSVLLQGSDANNQNISNLAEPINNQDAATKAYVDALENQLQILKNTMLAGGYVYDIDGNSYNTIKIGNQIWMTENLKTTQFNDTTAIPLLTNSTSWNNTTSAAYCWYNNSTSNANTYGALYNYYTINTAKLCPVNWHVPSNAEWTALISFLGGNTVAGGKLKETDTTHWNSPNIGATNSSWFTALASGHRSIYGNYFEMGATTSFWTATSTNSASAYLWKLYTNNDNAANLSYYKKNGLSVRCIKD